MQPGSLSLGDNAGHHSLIFSEDPSSNLVRFYDDLLNRVRGISGFQNLLHSIPLEELTATCRHGLPSSSMHAITDALILCPPGHIVYVPLPVLNLAMHMHSSLLGGIGGLMDRLRIDRAVRVQAKKGNRRIVRILEILWDCVIQPVLRAIESEVSVFTRLSHETLLTRT
jgi:hypothetical protein